MADLTGQTLGKYQLVERLGRGGMADVYKGFQPGLDRYVAVKVLHPHLSEEADFITRFQREAKSVANLRHKHIVQVFDFDTQGEHYYMVMEYIEGGRTLKEILQENIIQNTRLPLSTGLDIAAKLADALDYAHGKGMIHRDIKPSNVLVPNLRNPVLGDFGIARLMGMTGLTGSGAMIGTPAYMSPEQGRGEAADERSDIYALGIILYEMLTGKPPYDADTPYAVILKHINDPLVPPHEFVEALPEAAERIVLKCLAKNPNYRYATIGDMRDALKTVVDQIEDDTAISRRPPVDVTLPGQHDDADTSMMDSGVMDENAASSYDPAPTRRVALPLLIGGGTLGTLVVAGLVLGLSGAFSKAEDEGPPAENPQSETADSVAADATDTSESAEADSEAVAPISTAMPTPMPKSSVVDALVVAHDDFDSLHAGSAWYVDPQHDLFFNIDSGLLRVGGGETYMNANTDWHLRAGESSAILCKLFLEADSSFHFGMDSEESVALSGDLRSWGMIFAPNELVAFTYIDKGNDDDSEYDPYEMEGLTPVIANASYYFLIGTDGGGLLVAQVWLENDPGGRVEVRQDLGSEWAVSEWVPGFYFAEGSAEITIDFCELLYTIPN